MLHITLHENCRDLFDKFDHCLMSFVALQINSFRGKPFCCADSVRDRNFEVIHFHDAENFLETKQRQAGKYHCFSIFASAARKELRQRVKTKENSVQKIIGAAHQRDDVCKKFWTTIVGSSLWCAGERHRRRSDGCSSRIVEQDSTDSHRHYRSQRSDQNASPVLAKFECGQQLVDIRFYGLWQQPLPACIQPSKAQFKLHWVIHKPDQEVIQSEPGFDTATEQFTHLDEFWWFQRAKNAGLLKGIECEKETRWKRQIFGMPCTIADTHDKQVFWPNLQSKAVNK